ncbi:MAG: hypothetical protein HKN91_10710 [Acidimicrobiia bacterium]|nr:hypothetical protein [Acidimicrobiia bacterium]
MRRLIVVLGLALAISVGAPGSVEDVHAGENYVCWYVEVVDPFSGKLVPGMRCRIDGTIHEPGFPGEGPVEVPMVYDLGFVDGNECYYRRSGPASGWVVRGRNGTLLNFWWDTGNGFIGDAWIDQCTKEPVPGQPPITLVYGVLDNYEFVEPTPDVVPDGIGLTGARTYIYVDPPDPFFDQLNSPVGPGFIDIEIRVVAVEIDWGDDAISTIPESQFGLFAPHPDGEVGHPWETKDVYTLGVDYEWLARWRVNGGPWQIIDIPNTEWETPYQVDEVVGRRSG